MLKKIISGGKAVAKQQKVGPDVISPGATVSRLDPDFRTPLPDVKGQRRDPFDKLGGLPASKKTTEERYRLGDVHSLHPREVRVKAWLSFIGFAAWYIGVFAFITARLGNDDLDTLEKEARQQIDLRKKIKADFLDKQ